MKNRNFFQVVTGVREDPKFTCAVLFERSCGHKHKTLSAAFECWKKTVKGWNAAKDWKTAVNDFQWLRWNPQEKPIIIYIDHNGPRLLDTSALAKLNSLMFCC